MNLEVGRYWARIVEERTSRPSVPRGAAPGGMGLAAASLAGGAGEESPPWPRRPPDPAGSGRKTANVDGSRPASCNSGD